MSDSHRGIAALTIRPMTEADVAEIGAMVDEFVKGHPAENQPRPAERLLSAYLRENPVAHVLVASRGEHVVGMGQWCLIYDMFWGKFAGRVEWLYVKPHARGTGIPVALVAECCRQIREAGGEFVYAGSESDRNGKLYERVAVGWESRTCSIGAEAFQTFADLAGRSPRDIVRNLPDKALNHEEPRPRPAVR